jgi:lipopolysaccharide export system protein LptA
MKTLLGLFFLAAATLAHAESADRDKPIQVEADAGSYNDLQQSGVFTGNVRVTKGTIRVTGAQVHIRKDPEGYEYATVTAPAGGVATFRQRRDPTRPGVQEHIEGEAERIEYDGKTETVKLVTRAQLRRLENEVQRDELRGNLITYNNRTSQMSVEGGAAVAGADNRVRAVIAPRSRGPEKGSAPVPLKSERTPEGASK